MNFIILVFLHFFTNSATKTVAAIATSATQQGGDRKNKHVFQEKSNREQFSAHSQSEITYISKADGNERHSVIFAVANRNILELTTVLEDVSNPTSPNYGKHWSKQEVVEFTVNREAHEAITNHLSAIAEVVIDKETLNGEYIFATAPVHVWEDMFATTLHSYTVDGTHIIRAEDYSLPANLHGHVSTVFNIVHFLADESPMNSPRETSSISTSVNSSPNVLNNVKANSSFYAGSVTPELIKKFYSVHNFTGSRLVSQAVFETSGGRYCQKDLRAFEDAFDLPHQHVSIAVRNQDDDAYSATYGINYADDYNVFLPCDPEAGGYTISNLDIQYITAIAPGTRTYLEYTKQFWLAWIIAVVDTEKPANVYSLSWYSFEGLIPLRHIDSFNIEAIKLGVMGTTVLLRSGGSGVSTAGYSNGKCGYIPEFASPYVTVVGATMGPEANKPEVACESTAFNYVKGSIDHPSTKTSGGGFSNVTLLCIKLFVWLE